MSEVSNWSFVDDFNVHQAAALWCNYDPSRLSISDDRGPSEVMAIKQMLTGAIVAGDLIANSTTNTFASIGDHSKSLVTRSALRDFAKSKNLYPAFLFDTLAPFVDPRDASAPRPIESASTAPPKVPKGNIGGRPAEYDWDSFTMEIIRIADLPDGLPETQAELIRVMLTWFNETYETEPAESTIKQRISKIYNYLGKDKNLDN